MQKGHYQWIFVLFLLAGAQLSYAQGFRFSGKVVDKQTGEPLQGAVVYIHETGKHSVCQPDGSFSLDNLKPAVYHIHAYMLSYEPFAQNFRVVKDTIVIIAMEPTSIELKNFTIESEMVKTEAVKSPLSIESANRDFIEKQSGNTFINALEKIPGISSINVGVGISKPVIRGMSFNRVVVTENGIKQEGQQWGADHGLELDQFNVERVEILKGPASLIYGSDALGGVINILPPAIPEEGKLKVSVLGFYRSNNDAVGSSAMMEGRYKRSFFRVRGTWQEFGDYKVPADTFFYNTYRLPIYNQRLKNTAGKELNFSATAGIMRDWGMLRFTFSDFSQTMGFFPGAMGIPRAYSLQHDGDYRNIGLPNQSIFHRKFITNFNIKTRKGWLENDLGYQINYRTESSAPHVHGVGYIDPSNTTALGLDLYTLSFNSRLHTLINDRLKNITGIQVQRTDNFNYGFEFLIPRYMMRTAGIYSLFTWEKTE
ncbi:MAG: TonB-dependent receptor plug domain-containing protein, partial [Flavobacteriales bacterium]